jgi:hypothetical protein
VPTGPNNALLPIRKATKQRLDEAKGAQTYDALLNALLAAVPPAQLKERLEAEQAREEAALASRKAFLSAPPELRRSGEKQVLIARMAERGWRRWLREGKIQRLGPRRYRWNLASDLSERGPGVIVRVLGRRRR